MQNTAGAGLYLSQGIERGEEVICEHFETAHRCQQQQNAEVENVLLLEVLLDLLVLLSLGAHKLLLQQVLLGVATAIMVDVIEHAEHLCIKL